MFWYRKNRNGGCAGFNINIIKEFKIKKIDYVKDYEIEQKSNQV